ncbi:crotonobetaine/carnitine-CoA ligase [Sinobacterium caligoides]|uniref:Crotonobetaine/carnitine-CoA ligase n=1 Tax=Sinobacterium caligoides TaxID=933926 RepID=A0A3N2DQM4_9GAMM|nr:AMP-binding protein [Sinobacterium caligoides]ROS01982.1 crotonobetaine/carnitine-CoA ligase [Sinobacterium caligoides]
MTDLSRAAELFEYAGQDIPWKLKHWATHRPDHPFLVWEPRSGNDQTWTYKRFDEEVAKLAGGLYAKGVKKGDKVLLHCDNCPEMVLAWYACAKLGAIGVTTNTRSVGGEIAYFADHTKAVGAITQPQYAQQVADNAKHIGWLVVTEDNSGEPASAEQVSDLPLFDTLYGDASVVPERPAEPMLPAGIMFTSGTTSLPKAVVHTHANALWSGKMGASSMDLRQDDKYLAFLPFFHVNAQSWAFWGAMGVGATAILQPKFSASRFWQVIEKHQVTHCSMIPFVFKAIGAQAVPEQHTLRVIPMGIIWKEIGGWLGCEPFASWGMTETVTHATRSDFVHDWPQHSIGKPTPGYQLAIVNEETGAICEQGEIGELWVKATRGVQIFLEYYDNEEANNKAFTDDGWFKTGDRVRLGEEGDFFFCDRDKDALKVGGENVSARQVEEVCMQVPGIGEIAIVARRDEMLDMVPVGFVIKGFGAPESDAEFCEQIIAHCAANLADFKVPRAIHIVEDFPRAALEKVAKNKLREMADELA